MGLKFWKKKEDDLGDLGDMSDLGDFGLDSKSGMGTDDLGLGSDALPPEQKLPGMDEHTLHDSHHQGMEPPIHPGEPSNIDRPASFEQQGMGAGTVHATQATPYQSVPQQPMPQQASGLHDLSKDIEIMHAKLDAIRSSLDSINQRLATLERMASGDNKTRYNW